MTRLNEWLRELLFLPEQASTVALEIDALHYFVILTTMLGATAVAVMTAVFLLRYRSRDRRAPTPHWEMGSGLKLGLLGLLVALFCVWWWLGLRQYTRIAVAPRDTTEVYVVAKQWMFKFSYPAGRSTVHTLYVPAGQPIKLIMTSRDVIHDLYVPEFRVKQDIVPGLYTTAWFEAPEPGVYEILCAEFCGTDHSRMRGKVVVLPPAEYAAGFEGGFEGGFEAEYAGGFEGGLEGGADGGLGERGLEGGLERGLERGVEGGLALAEVGRSVAADAGCLRCHTLDGSPHIGPSFANLYGAAIPLADGSTVVADVGYLTRSMMDPLAQLHRGYQPVMPSYKGRLDAPDVAALVELIESLRDGPGRSGDGPEAPPAAAEGVPVYQAPTLPRPQAARREQRGHDAR